MRRMLAPAGGPVCAGLPPWGALTRNHCPALPARNITTNELANMHRYPYLRTKDGQFTNPCAPGGRLRARHSSPVLTL